MDIDSYLLKPLKMTPCIILLYDPQEPVNGKWTLSFSLQLHSLAVSSLKKTKKIKKTAPPVSLIVSMQVPF